MEPLLKKILFEGKFKRFVKTDDWEYTERTHGQDVVAIYAETDDQKVIFVEQFRVPVDRCVIELPAGITNDLADHQDETLEEAARRELLEETGYEAEEFLCIGKGPSSAASISDIITLFYAKRLKKVGKGGGDHTESIIVHEIDRPKVDVWLREMQKKDYYVDPKIYAGLYMAQKIRENHLPW